MSGSGHVRWQARQLNAQVDACLLDQDAAPREFAARLPDLDAAALAERVRRRATLLARRDRSHADAILTVRDALILAVYARATPRDAFTAWCDGSCRQGEAGIGGLLMDPEGRITARLCQPMRGLDAFGAEIAALEAMMRAAPEHGAVRLRVYTDCIALLLLWLEKRADPRLGQVRQLARRFRRFELRALPRLHNQSANRLARQALAAACARESAPHGPRLIPLDLGGKTVMAGSPPRRRRAA